MAGTGKAIAYFNPTGESLIDGVLSGTGWGGRITYAFPQSASNYAYATEPGNNFDTISLRQRAAALFALESSSGNRGNDGFSVEGFTKANISMGSANTATIRFAQSDTPSTAYAYLPEGYQQAGDVWFGTQYDYRAPMAGNYAWNTMLHEIGHALGLKHGHEADGVFDALPAKYDSLEYSLMTYRNYINGPADAATYSTWSAPQTYMMADIAALQDMYGADYSTNKGDTIYKWRAGSGDTFVNDHRAINAGGEQIFATIWDGGGIDTYDLRTYKTNLKIDLSPGGHSVFSHDQLAELASGHFASGNIYNALLHKNDPRSLIENAIGGSGNDRMTGNIAANALRGLGGSDRLNGGAGNDRLFGGAGRDVFVMSSLKGKDTIGDFETGSDRVDVSNTDLADFADILHHATQSDHNVTIEIDGGSRLVILDIGLKGLSADDFIL
jgi:serralysin